VKIERGLWWWEVAGWVRMQFEGVETVLSHLKAFHTPPIENRRIPGNVWLLRVSINTDYDSR